MPQFETVGVRAVVEGVQKYLQDGAKVNKTTADMGVSSEKAAKGFDMGARSALKFGASIAAGTIGVQSAVQVLKSLVTGTVGAAIAFESSFAGIRKTMDLTEAGFEELERSNRELAKSIPVTVNELNRIGELGGQLGIRGIRNIVAFERTIASIAVTTNLTAEDAALAFAQIANVMQLPQEKIENLGASIVGLGNNFATTEAKITDFVLRIAGAGQIVGLTVGDITGIGTAFASLGVEAEAGGTAIQKILLEMNVAVTTASDNLTLFADVAGMSVAEFADLFERDAGGAFRAFVEGLGRAGDDASLVLEKLGIADQRVLRSFLAAAGAGDLLARAMQAGNAEFERGLALQEEAAKRFGTTASQIQIAKNNFNDLGISLGTLALPMMVRASEMAVQLARSFDYLGERTELMKAILLGTAMAISFALFGPVGAFAVGLGVMTQFSFDWQQFFMDLPTPVQNAVIMIAEAFDNLNLAVFESLDFLIRKTNDVIGKINLASPFDDIPLIPEINANPEDGLADRLRQDQLFGEYFREQERQRIARLRRNLGAEGAGGGGITLPEGAGGLDLGGTTEKAKSNAKERERFARQLADAVVAAEKEIRDAQVRSVDQLGDLITGALQRQYRKRHDVQIAEIDAMRETWAKFYADQITDAEKARDAQIAAIESVRDSTVAGLNAQMRALDDAGNADELADLERQRAIAFDPEQQRRIDQQIAEFHRDRQRDALRDQIAAAEENAQVQIDAAQAASDQEIEFLRQKADAREKIMQNEADAARAIYERQTDDYAIEAEARVLLEKGAQDEIVALLESYAPQWRTAGQTLGEQLVDGLRAANIGAYVSGALGAVPGTTQATAANADRDALIAGLQAQGARVKAQGVPDFVLDSLRNQVAAAGAMPRFITGGTVPGAPGRAVPIMAHGQERILPYNGGGGGIGGGGPMSIGDLYIDATFQLADGQFIDVVDQRVSLRIDGSVGNDGFAWGVRRTR